MTQLKHVLRVDQFSKDFLLEHFERADHIRRLFLETEGGQDTLRRKFPRRIMLRWFYEKSTRTWTSFGLAAMRLGMSVDGTADAYKFSSKAKGETEMDTMLVLNQYLPDVIVIRHDVTGSVAKMAEYSEVPIINAGDGKGEHPTQFLLDAYTIWRHHGRLDNLTGVIGGDLLRGRTTHSLALGLSMFEGMKFIFISHPDLMMKESVKQVLRERGVQFTELHHLDRDAMSTGDFWYWSRDQLERPKGEDGEDQPEPESADRREPLIITPRVMEWMKPTGLLGHPLPIDRENGPGEISVDVYPDPRCLIFGMVQNGLWSRMSLIEHVIRGNGS